MTYKGEPIEILQEDPQSDKVYTTYQGGAWIVKKRIKYTREERHQLKEDQLRADEMRYYEYPTGPKQPTLEEITQNMPALVYLMGVMILQSETLQAWAANEQELAHLQSLYGPNVRLATKQHEGYAFKVTLKNPLVDVTEDVLNIGGTLSIVHTTWQRTFPRRSSISINNRSFAQFLRNYGFLAGINPTASVVRQRLSPDLEPYFNMGLRGETPTKLS